MGPALLVTQNLRERYPVFVYRLVPYHDFFHVTRTSVTIANDGLPPPPLVDGMPMALMAFNAVMGYIVSSPRLND